MTEQSVITHVTLSLTGYAQFGCSHIYAYNLAWADYRDYGTCLPVAYNCPSHKDFLAGKVC